MSSNPKSSTSAANAREAQMLASVQKFLPVPLNPDLITRDMGCHKKTMVTADTSKLVWNDIYTKYNITAEEPKNQLINVLVQHTVLNGTSQHGSLKDSQNPCYGRVGGEDLDLGTIQDVLDMNKVFLRQFMRPLAPLAVKWLMHKDNALVALELAKKRGFVNHPHLAFDYADELPGLTVEQINLIKKLAQDNYDKSSSTPKKGGGAMTPQYYTPVRQGGYGHGNEEYI